MHFTSHVLTVLATSLLVATANAAPKCHVGTAWPDPSNCHKFFECSSGGIPVHKSCGPGTAYSPKLKICDYEQRVPSCHRSGKPDWKPHWSTDDDDKGKGKGKGKDQWSKNEFEKEKRQDLHSGWYRGDDHKHRHPDPRPHHWWNEHFEDHRARPEWPVGGYENAEDNSEQSNEETNGDANEEVNEEVNEETKKRRREWPVGGYDNAEDNSEQSNEQNEENNEENNEDSQ
ncbi:hypothetical protein ASPSYDRAFT_469217 [Aspergillus sydowii CBS 593.65]|uniref:Chitin-binding type-2 domain-containing protein n=1 Tax=Aspergillus sydowii CBS 593.65 TaxID=1036612 RepID=A0A1L9T592_9EURO|nr:uncharacterized protein ASPSYDRAFT_469217 [Aspergillus sydowii CBS 593.65]OJJ54577.1 hypothetical protein ASPSYDRAFT_469217 [Aspergillus sydowii CBS 593.65]